MTPQEKARELVNKFYEVPISYDTAKDCAKIAVNEIIDAIDWHVTDTPNEEFTFWGNVLNEIDKT
jgi:hypothetical protein